MYKLITFGCIGCIHNLIIRSRTCIRTMKPLSDHLASATQRNITVMLRLLVQLEEINKT